MRIREQCNSLVHNSNAGMPADGKDALMQALCNTTHRGAEDKLFGSPYTFLCPAALECVYNKLMCLQHHSVALVTEHQLRRKRIGNKQ